MTDVSLFSETETQLNKIVMSPRLEADNKMYEYKKETL